MRDLKIVSACQIKTPRRRTGWILLHLTDLVDNPSPLHIRRDRLSVFPYKRTADGLDVKWDWASDGYGSVPYDASILEAAQGFGLLNYGRILVNETRAALGNKLAAMAAEPYRSVPCPYAYGGIFSFAPATYRPEAPALLADAIEEILAKANAKEKT